VKHTKGRKRIGGGPFIHHPVRVALSIIEDADDFEDKEAFERCIIVALLHDVIEDTNHTKNSLTLAGFGGYVDDIYALSRRKPQECEVCAPQWDETHDVSEWCKKQKGDECCQTHWDFIRAIRDYAIGECERYMNHTVIKVKFADITDNMVTADELGPTMRERYMKSLVTLRNPNT
jgi:(p)ppGpp synthase/HD superfamily hydrolase